MGGSADPEDPAPTPTPTPSPSPAKPPLSPSSSSAKRLKRCVQSRLSFGAGKSGGGGGGGGGGVVLPAPAAEEADGKVAAEEPGKGRRRGRQRKSEAAKKPSSNKETNGLDPGSKDEVISIDESPQKKQRKGRNQDAARKVPNRKRCKVLESTDGHESHQQLHSSQTEAVLPEGSPLSVDIDLNSVPSEAIEADDNDVLDNEDKPQVIVDLRSEAKIAAQEIRMLSSGKKMHPFFASRKLNKGSDQDVLNIEDTDSPCATERDPPFWPVHVVYQLETSIPIHWSKWLIMEGSFLNTRAADTLENSVSFREGFVEPLTIESNCKRMCPDQLVEQNLADHTASGMDFPNFSNEQSESKFSSLDVVNLDDECLLTFNSSRHASLSYTKHPERILQGCPEVGQKSYQPSYYLWTDKYQPETAAQVCGNVEHVKFLSEWLKGWDERGHKKKQNGAANESISVSSCQDESDTDCSEDASDYENVLLITGPVGCGKSAAVFACAREQGFNVIEVNTSDMRNGAYVKQKFEEATKSHGLEKWSQEEDTTSPRIDSLDPDRTEFIQSVSCPTGKTSNSNEHKSPAKCYLTSKLSGEAHKQVINKTLILFEDVDTVFDEDRGFISTILKIAETTKWPIILTSNKKDPSLPNLLDQLVLDFKYPSSGELLSHVDMICKSEGADVAGPQLKYIISACLGDIRRTTMLLQFWYQGKQQYTERSNKSLSSPFSLDLDAVHSTVSRMLPWEFPCKLSETVSTEIEKTILLAEEKKRQMEVSEFEALELQIIAPLTKGRSSVKTRKIKKSKLKHGLSTECNNISPCKNDLDDFDDDPDTSLSFDQQRMRNKKGVVLLSESDDDQADAHIAEDAKFTVPEGGLFSQPSEVPLIHEQGISNQFYFPSESRETFGITKSFQNQFESDLVGSISQICDTFVSQGVSCVPESSLVGGVSASVSSDDLLSSMVSNGLSTFNNGGVCTMPITAVEDTTNVRNLMAETHKCMEDVVGETCEAYAESFGRNEQASCSTAGYQLMDECSQAGSIWLLSGKKTNDCYKVECVQDTWNRLRRCCPVPPRETNHNRTVSGALKLASSVSDLISESDLMLAHCYPHINDILDPSSTPCAEPDDLSWYDKQLEMGSVYSQHALCVFSRDSQDKGGGFIDLSQELLFANTTARSLGKLISSGISSIDGFGNISHMKNPTRCISKGREQLGHLCEALLPVVPSKLSLSLRGPAFVDYLSSMCQISQLENLRLSENKAGNKQRRCRRSRHYLSSGALSLSPEGLELLAQSGHFGDKREKVIEQENS